MGANNTLQFLVLLASLFQILCVWTEFDLVRNRIGAWGSEGTTPFTKIKNPFGSTTGGAFGFSVANIGDIDKDGIDDIAVGAPNEKVGQFSKAGGIYILFMQSNGSMKSANYINGAMYGIDISNGDQFGYSISLVGDLDGDSVNDIAVGAPGDEVSSVYLLMLTEFGNVKSVKTIRGNYEGQIPPFNYTPRSYNVSGNGPPIRYGSRFGSAITAIGDYNNDTIPDLAISAIDRSSGKGSVYLIFLNYTGQVINYVTLSPELPLAFSGFGSSITLISDLDGNNVTDLAIGAKFLYDAGSVNYHAGEVIICFMNANHTINRTSTISEMSRLYLGEEYRLPVVSHDLCGSSIANIGDINLDNMRQHYPSKISQPQRASYTDFIMGCPQSDAGNLPGRLFMIFLSKEGEMRGYNALPAESDYEVGLKLYGNDQFGQGLAAYYDIDNNGLKEIIVGAPGDDDEADESGAVYILFLRRRRYHAPVFNFLRFILLVTLFPWCCCTCIISSIAYFFWYFRRKPDDVEIIVKKSGYEINPNRPRSKYQKSPGAVYIDYYPH